MSTTPICPCDGFEHPASPRNQPALARVNYRVGDFLAFRRALLRPLPKEESLTLWRPNDRGDLLLQALEWWAYIADVLTFYNEHSLNENLLRTASLDESVRRTIRILGYRPRPGIAASANVGVLLSGPKPVALAAGFAIDSKPAPGKQPQTFETAAAASLSQPDAVPAAPPGLLAGPLKQLYLQGAITSIQPGELLLLKPAAGPVSQGVLFPVAAVNQAKDTAGNPYTELVPSGSPALPAAVASGFRLLRSQRSTGLWQYPTTTFLVMSPLDPDVLLRDIKPGDPIVLTAPASTGLPDTLIEVTANGEETWYTNGNGSTAPTGTTIPIGVPHSRISYTPGVPNDDTWDANKTKVRLLIDWQPAGVLRDSPVAAWNGTPQSLAAAPGSVFRVADNQTVLIEDADGNGVLATATVTSAAPSVLQILSFVTPPPPVLKTPLRVLHNLISLTNGKSVAGEILGSGDPTIAGQEFLLKKSPLTYLPAGDSYKSTLSVFVEGVQWTEAQSFFDQPPNATVYVTREDDEVKTHVLFGDGVNGARLPAGRDNIAAFYRFGSGLDAPEPGALTLLSKPQPGVRAVRQPVAAGGGADPDPREQIRTYAPKSVLTFGRAISADDYEAVAAGAPSVARVRAYYAWNAAEQRATVTLYAGDTPAAVESARQALRESADPNRPVSVLPAAPVPAALFIAIRVDAHRILADVVEAVRDALADPAAGLLGVSRVRIGESFFFSQIAEACLRVPGVNSAPFALALFSRPDPVTGFFFGIPPRIHAGEGEFFQFAKEFIFIFPEVLTSV